MADDLDVLDPAGSSVPYRGETVEILPIPVGALPKLVRVARPVIDRLLDLEALPEEGDDGALVALMLNLVEHHGENVFAAAAICTGKPQDWLEGGDVDEFIVLAMRVFEVNRDFFVRRLAPLLAGLGGKVAAMTGVGPTPSSSSSSAATA